MDKEIERFTDLSKQLRTVEDKKIRLEEQFKTKKEALSELIKEIKDAGYDPTKLKEIIQTKEEELKKDIAAFEAELSTASSLLSKIEA